MKDRIVGVDGLRGLVMVVMVLDHVRDFFGPTPFDPGDAAAAPASWFVIRWVTHFCAPVFVLLAGTSAWMKGRNVGIRDLRIWLVKRGAWLIVLEFAVVTPLFMASAWINGFHVLVFQVIWVIGVGFLVLAATAGWPRPILLALSLAMIAGHNLLDGVDFEGTGVGVFAWDLLHTGNAFHRAGDITIGGVPTWLYIVYPLVPWVGVLTLGWVLGAWLEAPAPRRFRRALTTGLSLVAVFIGMRIFVDYGDPLPWTRSSPALAFLQCEKYPPSLCYLLMTLGPACIAFAFLDRLHGAAASILKVFGRVPLFFYLAHLVVINAGAALICLVRDRRVGWWWGPPRGFPDDYDPSVAWTLLVWLAIVALLYLPCRAWARLKRERPGTWIQWL